MHLVGRESVSHRLWRRWEGGTEGDGHALSREHVAEVVVAVGFGLA